jgi:MoxR-like ATPase
MPKIVFADGAHAGEERAVGAEGLVLGRASDAGMTIRDVQVSGYHARIAFEDDAWWIHDLDSSNGTQVNGRAVHAIRLNDRDKVQLGDTVFVFRDDAVPVAPPLPRTQPPAALAPPVGSLPVATLVAAEPLAGAAEEAAGGGIEEQATEAAEEEPGALPPTVMAGAPAAAEPLAAVLAATEEEVQLVRRMNERTEAIRQEVARTIIGQREVLDQVLMCLLAGGHGLLVGLPGMAKTLMVRTVARVLDLKFKRIQFTPDLMPSDITGTEVLEVNRATGEKEFRFIRGPIFCNLLLADEINRTPPKTQAALLEAMQEKRVTVGNVTYGLDEPFFVLATQNPIEQEGTYPLPEAQLDRFMFNIWVDYPEEHEEEQIVSSTTTGRLPDPRCVLSQHELLQLQEVVRKIPVSPHVVKYVIRLVRATRPGYPKAPAVTKDYVSTGAGPRAGQFLVLAAKARAVLEGRIHVSCRDIRSAAIPVLRHRILTNFAADSEGLTPMDIVRKLLEQIEEPGEAAYAAAG